MPRLTFTNYQVRYKLLHETRRKYPESIAQLSVNDQWALFEYFQFHKKLSQRELRTQWMGARTRAGSLPQRAGRAYMKFRRALIATLESWRSITERGGRSKPERVVRLYGEVHPQINIDELVQVVMMLGRQLCEEAER